MFDCRIRFCLDKLDRFLNSSKLHTLRKKEDEIKKNMKGRHPWKQKN